MTDEIIKPEEIKVGDRVDIIYENGLQVRIDVATITPGSAYYNGYHLSNKQGGTVFVNDTFQVIRRGSPDLIPKFNVGELVAYRKGGGIIYRVTKSTVMPLNIMYELEQRGPTNTNKAASFAWEDELVRVTIYE